MPPVSSYTSRFAACSNDSPDSALPPGNSSPRTECLVNSQFPLYFPITSTCRLSICDCPFSKNKRQVQPFKSLYSIKHPPGFRKSVQPANGRTPISSILLLFAEKCRQHPRMLL